MDKDEALRMALEALHRLFGWQSLANVDDQEFAKQAITTIEEALAQPEPVQVTINDFVAVVNGKEDWVGRPVYWAQWPNEEKNT